MDQTVDSIKDQQSVAEAFLATLMDHGIEYVFANAGTDFAPIIESLVAANQSGKKVPNFVTVPHENVAIAMAQGYFRVAGKPAAVMVHVSVGTANTICGVMNANRDNVPVLMMAGRTPLTESGNIGSRNNSIHWGQENFDQGGMLREFVKWDYELRTGQPVEEIVGRALDIAMSEPCGPVYLTLPREVLGGAAPNERILPRPRALGNAPVVPGPEVIDQAARMIAEAKNPLIVTGKVGARPGAVEALSSLAEKFAIPVVQVAAPSMLSDHPMNLGFKIDPFLGEADLVMVVESAVPWLPRNTRPNDQAKFIHVSSDPQFANYPSRSFAMDIAVAGDPIRSLNMIEAALGDNLDASAPEVTARRQKVTDIHDAQQVKRNENLEKASGQMPISPPLVAACLNKLKSDDTIILSELGINVAHVDHKTPLSYISGGQAGGLGYGLGMSLGAKLAAPDREVVLVVGDGSYMFGNPTPAHFVGIAENLPTLTIVMNNSQWFAVRRATNTMYPDGKAAKANEMPLTDLNPSPNFAKTMEACGGYGEEIIDPDKLEEAIQRGLEKVRAGIPVLLNVRTKAGGRDDA
ncbi:MAG: thiamine pyrophosphate-requiring protein [Rhodospirillaceae bacterium]|jgi:acetolactate synthase I/II/III large subunit|nr:thiamine pyrophosphate-requiring protein [Rhodospirillaceae bacterium]